MGFTLIHVYSNFVDTLVCSRNVLPVIHKSEIQESHTGPLIGLVSWGGIGFQVMCV